METQKTLNNTTTNQAKDQVSDLETWGYSDMWKLLCKASSESEGWMKSTKAMEVNEGCLVQVTTQQGGNVAESVTFVPGVKIEETLDQPTGGKVISRRLVPIPEPESYLKTPNFHTIFDFKSKFGRASISISADNAEDLEENIRKWKEVQERTDI